MTSACPTIPPSTLPPRRCEDRRAGDLPLCAGRRGRTSAGRRGALVAGAVAAGARRRHRHARRIADPAQGAGGQGDPRGGARERSPQRSTGMGSRRRRIRRRETARSSAGKARRGLAKFPRRLAGSALGDPQQGRPRLARVHAILAARAVARRSAQAPAGTARSYALRRQVASDALESWTLEPSKARLGRRPARDLDPGRSLGPRPPARLPQAHRTRLCRRSRPPGSRGHLTACRRI